MPTFRLRTPIPNASAQELYDWHARPGAFHRLNPPWEPVRVVERSGVGLQKGAKIAFLAPVGPFSVRWEAEHVAHDPPRGFSDAQRRGPFRSWIHHHRFVEREGADPLLEDEIEWEAPFGALGAAIGGIDARLQRVFSFRHRRTRRDLARHARHRDQPRLRVLVSGSSGLIGTALTAFLDAGGHEVIPLVRSPELPGVYANFAKGVLDPDALEGIDAVVHLAGAPIADAPWTEERRALIRASRVDSTATIARVISSMKRPPKVWLSGSAVGIYGASGDAICVEEAPPGDTFLAAVGRDWEAATQPAEAAGVRVVHLRTGLVLSAQGGLLTPMLPLFRAGLGGPTGSGRQFMPWIHIDDVLGLILEALFDERYVGPLNVTAPNPVRYRAFAKALGAALGRPAFFAAPSAAVRLFMGSQRAEEIVLTGQRAVPARAQELGFEYAHPHLEDALRFELGRLR